MIRIVQGCLDTKLVNYKINSLINKVVFKQCKELSLFYFHLKDFIFVCISFNLHKPNKLKTTSKKDGQVNGNSKKEKESYYQYIF